MHFFSKIKGESEVGLSHTGSITPVPSWTNPSLWTFKLIPLTCRHVDRCYNYSYISPRLVSVCTCEVEGKGDKSVVFAEDAKRLLSLHQSEEAVRHGFTIEEVVDTQQEVPVGWKTCSCFKASQQQHIRHSVCLQKNQ